MNTTSFILKYRLWLIIIPLVITLLMLLPLRHARINPDLMDYLPDDIEAKVNMDKIEGVFGKFDPVIIFFKTDDVLNEATLERLRKLDRHFSRLREFEDVFSIYETKYIRGEYGMMLVDPVITRIPQTHSAREKLREEIIDNELAYKLLISEDFRYTLMLLNPAEDVLDAEVFALINEALAEYPGDEKIYMSGLPYLRDEIQKRGTRDLALLFPLGMLVMIIFLYISFRQLRSVFLPFSVVLLSVVVAMGLMPLLGYDYSLIAVLVPIMLISIANNYGVHIVARYQELNARFPDWSMKKISVESISLLRKPIILTALTTIIGVMGLYAHVMIPARQMGIATSAGIAFALLLSLFFIPAIMTYMKKGKPMKHVYGGNGSLIDKLLGKIGVITTKHPKYIILIFLVAVVVAGLGATRLKVSINLEMMLPSSHPLRISSDIANEEFGGTKNTTILFQGDILEPEVMLEIDKFESTIKKLPNVGGVNSIAGVLRIIGKAINDPGDEFYDTIPDNRMAIAQYIEFYNMSGDPEDFEKLVNFDYTKAVLNVQFKAKDMVEFNKVTSYIDKLIDNSEFAVMQAGQPLLERDMANSIIRGQVYSLAFALVAILILLGIIFRSVRAGLLGSLPLIICVICNFGLMGWFGFELDIATSLLSTIAIGIGVDYTIHLFWRLKQEVLGGASYKEAVVTTISTTGRGIAINALSVMVGFAVLFFSSVIILKTFAFLIIFSILLCLLGALVLMPAICVITEPSFLKRQDKRRKLQTAD